MHSIAEQSARSLRCVAVAVLLAGCATAPLGQPPRGRTVRAATLATLEAHRTDVRSVLAGLGAGDTVRRTKLREHLERLSRLEHALDGDAPGGPVDHSGLAEALEDVADAAFSASNLVRRAEHLAELQGTDRDALDPGLPADVRVLLESRAVVEAGIPLVLPPRTLPEAQAAVTLAATLVQARGDLPRALELARAASGVLPEDGRDPEATRTLAWCAWVEGQVHLAEGRAEEAVGALRRALALSPFPAFRETYGDALEAADRLEEAAVQFALLELVRFPEGRLHLERLSGRVDVDAARAAPEVQAQRERLEERAEQWRARREAELRPLDRLELVADGETHTVSDLRGSRRAVVTFWTRTCAPCVKELPVLARLQERFGELVFLPINGDAETGPARELLRTLGRDLPFLHVSMDAAHFTAGVEGWPTTVLLDEGGRECHRSAGFPGEEALVALLEAHAGGRCDPPGPTTGSSPAPRPGRTRTDRSP